MTTYVTSEPLIVAGLGAPGVYQGAADPSTAGGVPATMGAIYLRTTGALYWKSGAADTDRTPVSAGADGMFSAGVNGAITDNANRTLAAVGAYTDWTIDPGVIITAARFPLVCNGTLTIGAGAAIRANGSNGGPTTAGGAGGGAGAAGPAGFGSTGGVGGNPGVGGAAGTQSTQQPFGIGTTCQGGAGGAAAGGGVGGGGAGGNLTAQAVTSGSPYLAGPAFGFYPYAPVATPVHGGSGGGGGNGGAGTGVGGGGGGGGGVLVIIAKNVVNLGALEAKGGNGAAASAGNAGGGGGGGGGKVFLICRTYSGNAPDVSGGTGGALTGTGNVGVNGNSGLVVQLLM